MSCCFSFVFLLVSLYCTNCICSMNDVSVVFLVGEIFVGEIFVGYYVFDSNTKLVINIHVMCMFVVKKKGITT